MLTGSTATEIAASIEGAVASGALSPGARLPAVRALAASLAVSPTTVAAALAELRRRGVVVSRPRSGTRVSERPPVRPARTPAVATGVRDLALGNPDPALLPDLAGALRELLADDARGAAPLHGGSSSVASPPPASPPAGATRGSWQRLYGDPPVDPGLAAVAAAALVADGIPAQRLTVVNGALDGIERVLAAQLSPGDVVAVEDPGWPGVLDLVRALGLRLAPVAVDERGMRPEALEVALRTGARAASS